MRTFVTALFTLFVSLPGWAASFSGIYFFGDSLTDTGNVMTVYGSVPHAPGAPAAIPGPPYDAGGRFSNGPIYADVLAAGLGYTATASVLGGNDYAYGGARTRYQSGGLPGGLIDQVAAYRAAPGPADPNALYVVWGGSNNLQDILLGTTVDPKGQPIPGVAGTLADIGGVLESLYAEGARKLLVPNVPNLGLTPRLFEVGGAAAVKAGFDLSVAYNSNLNTLVLDGFAARHPDAELFRFDTFSFLNGVVANAGTFGFTNVSNRCYTGDDLNFTGGGTVCGDPSKYVFWDGIHPTATAHGLLGEAMLQAVPEPATYALMLLGLMLLARAARKSPPSRAS